MTSNGKTVLQPCCFSNFKETKDLVLANGDLANGQIDPASSSYALLVLILPCDPERKWLDDELDVVTAIAGQVIAADPTSEQYEESGIYLQTAPFCNIVDVWDAK